MLDRFFKPDWQHSNPQIRLKAIARMDAADAAQQHILGTLAKDDADLNVRCAAVAALLDIPLLLQCHAETTTAIVNAASSRLVTLLSGNAPASPAPDKRLAVIRQLHDVQLLSGLLEHTTDITCLLAALEQLKDQERFAHFALHGKDPTLREQCAAHVTDPALLRQLSRDGRDKKVIQSARDRLKQIQQQAGQEEQQRQQVSELLEQLKQQASRTLDPLFEARQTHLRAQWKTMASLATADQQAQAARHLEEADAHLAALQAAQQQLHGQQQAAAQQQRCISELSDLLNQLQQPDWQDQLNVLHSAFRHIEAGWQAANLVVTAPATEQTRYQRLGNNWLAFTTCFAELQALHDTAVTDPARWQEALQRWPASLALPDFAATHVIAHSSSTSAPSHEKNAHAKHPHGKNRHARHGSLLHSLREALNARHLREANRIWQRLSVALEKHPDDLSTQQAHPLQARLDELRDWHAFAADPKKLSLCERMEQLDSHPLTHPEEQANAIQALHDEWHGLMSSDQQADQQLWARFKLASDQAYAHCREHFQALDAQRAAMLERRIQLCDQLSGFLEQQNWETANGASLWEIRRQAPIDWQALNPVRYTDAREINQRFRQLLKHFDEKLDALSQSHAAHLEKLLLDFNALTAETDTTKAAQEAKRMQRVWRDAGWIHPQLYRKLEKQKRSLCDAIFQRQQEQQQQAAQQEQQLASNLRQELDQLQSLLATDDTDVGQLDQAMQQLRQQPEPNNAPALRQQKQALLKRAQSARSQQQRRQTWQHWQQQLEQAPDTTSQAALRELCVAMEVSAGLESPVDARTERLAWQVGTMAAVMKNRQAPEETCLRLLDEHSALITNGLDATSRTRLLHVITRLIAG